MTFSGIISYLPNESGGRFGLPIQSMPQAAKGAAGKNFQGEEKFLKRGLPNGEKCANIIKLV